MKKYFKVLAVMSIATNLSVTSNITSVEAGFQQQVETSVNTTENIIEAVKLSKMSNIWLSNLPNTEVIPLSTHKQPPVEVVNCFSTSSNIRTHSGLTAEEIEAKISEFPGLTGLGSTIYEVEQTYTVNAYFIIGVASLESGYGSSYGATHRNNLFGISYPKSYNSLYDNINNFGRLISDKYSAEWGLHTPETIAPTYCPPNSNWAPHVVSIMNRFANK